MYASPPPMTDVWSLKWFLPSIAHCPHSIAKHTLVTPASSLFPTLSRHLLFPPPLRVLSPDTYRADLPTSSQSSRHHLPNWTFSTPSI